MPISQPPETLTLWVLDKIADDWPGVSFQAGQVNRVDMDDGRNVDDGVRVSHEDLRDGSYITARTVEDTETQETASGPPDAEAVIEVSVIGLDEAEYGKVPDNAGFRQAVQLIKEALRTDRREIEVQTHPATWTMLYLENAQTQSGQYQPEYYSESFDVRLIGHY